ncbi:MAG: hypothetical protein IVW57_04455 [Ktedonobacterales bacterium]|nr:hypothetical protein [Ktedonobacterales bacterium]
MTAASDTPPEYITYEEAAGLLGITLSSLYIVVTRGQLHPVPDPANRRRRLLLRIEVEERARITRRHPYGIQPRSPARVDAARAEGAQLTNDERRLLVGVAAGTLALAAIVALARSDDPAIKGVAAGVLVALVLLCIAEWYRVGTIDGIERTYLEQLVKNADTTDEQVEHVMAAIDRYGMPAASVGLAS